MPKLPWMKFNPTDWLSELEVRALSLPARAVWFDMICIMWKSAERGVLPFAPQIESKEISKVTGTRPFRVQKVITEMEKVNVFSRRESDGRIYCRRMVREELDREKNRKRMSNKRAKKPILSRVCAPENSEVRIQKLEVESKPTTVAAPLLVAPVELFPDPNPEKPQPKHTDVRILYPKWLPRAKWDAFLDMRTRRKCANTPHAQRLLLKELTEIFDSGHDPGMVLDQSTKNSWKGLFPLKGDESRNGTAGEKTRRTAAIAAAPGKYAGLG